MRLLLFPISIIIQIALILRHFLYDLGLKRSVEYDLPLIGVGNLSFGGTGKTPTVEYLVQLLKPHYHVAILSRGYKRKRKGAFLLDEQTQASECGDEARQYKQKFPDIPVAVAEKRTEGMTLLLATRPAPQVVLLDDVFQHRAIKPGLNILITDYHKIYTEDYLFPTGTLRDIIRSARRANIIVVTKTPSILSPFIKDALLQSLRPQPHQRVFFSYLKFGHPYPIGKSHASRPLKNVSSILLVTGIANPYPLIEHLRQKCNDLYHKSFKDHHDFSEKDIHEIRSSFERIIGNNKLIVTTEKDASRLGDSPYFSILEALPILVQPIRMAFHPADFESFDQTILDYVRKASANS